MSQCRHLSVSVSVSVCTRVCLGIGVYVGVDVGTRGVVVHVCVGRGCRCHGCLVGVTSWMPWVPWGRHGCGVEVVWCGRWCGMYCVCGYECLSSSLVVVLFLFDVVAVCSLVCPCVCRAGHLVWVRLVNR